MLTKKRGVESEKREDEDNFQCPRLKTLYCFLADVESSQ
jgi:hypothetical protein